MPEYLAGTHAVEAAIRVGRRQVFKVTVSGHNDRLRGIIEAAEEADIPIGTASDQSLTDRAKVPDHQGVIATTEPFPETPFRQFLKNGLPALTLGLDQVQDPRNLGAIIRSAVAFGRPHILLPKDRSAPLSTLTAKSAVGMLEHAEIIRCGNLAQALRQLRDHAFIYALDGEGTMELDDLPDAEPRCIVLGAEGKGVRKQTRDLSHELVRIPIQPEAESLNVSVAAAIALYHFRLQ